MTCRFAHDDGAYVLGALSAADRQEFERHLPGCADCTRAVGELAGLPGLLGRVDASLVEQPVADGPVPELLPALSQEVRRARRRRVFAGAGLAAAAAVGVVAAVSMWQVAGDEAAAPAVPESSSSASPTAAVARPMKPVGDVPVHAEISLEQVTWGTRLVMTCTYETESVEYELPPDVDYTLHVRTRDGRAERVGSWRSVDGKPMQITAATAATAEELESVEVRTVGGRVVLRLDT